MCASVARGSRTSSTVDAHAHAIPLPAIRRCVAPRGIPTIHHSRASTSSVHRLAHPHLLHSRELYVPLHTAASPIRRPRLHQRGVLGRGIAPVAIDLRFDFSRPKMETRARAAQMIRRGVLREWAVCLLCFFGSLVA